MGGEVGGRVREGEARPWGAGGGVPGLGAGGGGFFIWGYYLAIYLGVSFYMGVPYGPLLGPYWSQECCVRPLELDVADVAAAVSFALGAPAPPLPPAPRAPPTRGAACAERQLHALIPG